MAKLGQAVTPDDVVMWLRGDYVQAVMGDLYYRLFAADVASSHEGGTLGIQEIVNDAMLMKQTLHEVLHCIEVYLENMQRDLVGQEKLPVPGRGLHLVRADDDPDGEPATRPQ